MRILVFGASTTQGFWDSEGGWVARLRKHYDVLQVRDRTSKQPVIFNLGISADTVGDVLARFQPETEARKRHGDLAFIFSIGSNNAAEGAYRLTFEPDAYEKGMEELVQQAKRYSEKILLVGLPNCDEKLTTPVDWADVHYTNERIKIIEDRMRKVAQENKLPFLAIFEEFKRFQEAGEQILFDGLHPNNKGHEFMASLIQPELEKLLKQAD